MRKQIVIILLIILNICILYFQLSDKKMQPVVDIMEAKDYPFSLVTDDENIYYIGIKFDKDGNVKESSLYEMIIGETQSQKIDIVPSDNMLTYKLYVDNNKNLNIFLCDKHNERCEIWKMSPNKEIIEQLDVTQSFRPSDAYGVSSFVIDGQGRYYLREYIGNETIVLDESGRELCRIADGDRGYHCSGCFSDGNIYILYETPKMNSEQMELTWINLEKGELETKSIGDFLPVNEIYSVLEADGKNEFLIKGGSGAYQYRLGKKRAKKLIGSFQNGEFNYNASTSCFLSSNKLLVIAKRQHMGEEILYGDVRLCYYAY